MLARQDCAAAVLGGPTTVLDLAGLRIVVDPTFDAPGPHRLPRETAGPVVDEDGLGPVDVVLVSHTVHPDNLDERGRAFALAAPLVLTGPAAAGELGPPAVGLPPWASHTVGDKDVTITAVPAVHSRRTRLATRTATSTARSPGSSSQAPIPTVYVSGDNASLRVVAEVARRFRASTRRCSSPVRPACHEVRRPSAHPRRRAQQRRRRSCARGGGTRPLDGSSWNAAPSSLERSTRRATRPSSGSPTTERGFRWPPIQSSKR